MVTVTPGDSVLSVAVTHALC